jgi:hypothetical protein
MSTWSIANNKNEKKITAEYVDMQHFSLNGIATAT